MMNSNIENEEHISFEDLSEYVFSNNRPKDYLAIAHKMNRHIMTCTECRDNYNALMKLREELDKAEYSECVEETTSIRLFSFLYSIKSNVSVQTLFEELKRFEKWISLNIGKMGELTTNMGRAFSHPELATVMHSSIQGKKAEETKSEIGSSILDNEHNRVSVGIDGTMTVYFDAECHSAGKRVIIIPDDMDGKTQMFELAKYDEKTTYVRFTGISPGQYTIIVEKEN